VAVAAQLGCACIRVWALGVVRTRGVSARTLLLGLIAVQLGIFYVLMHNSSWVFDDNFFLALAGQEGFTWHWLTSVQFEHWDIAEHLLISLQHRLFYLDFRWALGFMLLLLGASTYVLEQTLALMVRRRWISIAFAVWFGLSLIWARPLQWWAAGVQYFPYTFFDLLCLYGFMRFHAGGSRRWIAVSVAALAVALLFYEKPAYMLFYLVLLRALLMSEDLRPRVLLATFWRERSIWLSYVAVIFVWGLGYVHSHAYTVAGHGTIGIGQYLSYFRIFWLQTMLPSLAGITIPAAKLSALQILAVVALQVVFVLAVVQSLRRKRAAWRGWVFLFLVIFTSGVLVARSRIGIFGVDIANDPRYLIDFSWLVPLALCAAFVDGKVLRLERPAAGARLSLRAPRSVGVVLAVLLLVVYVAGTVASAARVEQIWAGPQGRTWESHLRGGIAALEHQGIRPMVAENTTPFVIMAEFVAPYNRLSRVLPLYVGPIQVDGPLDAPLVRIDEQGGVHRVSLGPPVGDGAILDLARSHQLEFSGVGRMVRHGAELCVIADGAPVTVVRRLASTDNPGSPLYLKLGYHAWGSMQLPVSADNGIGSVAVPDFSIALTARARQSIAWVGPGLPRRVAFTIPPLSTVCLSRIDVVSLKDEN
jgi:hypothetical protein